MTILLIVAIVVGLPILAQVASLRQQAKEEVAQEKKRGA